MAKSKAVGAAGGFRGIAAFADKFRVKRKLLVRALGIPLEEFLLTPAEAWLE